MKKNIVTVDQIKMKKISKTTAMKQARIFAENYTAHRHAIDTVEARMAPEIALEEQAKETLKDYASQNDAELFANDASSFKMVEDVVITRRSAPARFDFSKISKAQREYLMATYPNAFDAVKTRFIDGDDTQAQNLLKKCLIIGNPSYAVTVATNRKVAPKK